MSYEDVLSSIADALYDFTNLKAEVVKDRVYAVPRDEIAVAKAIGIFQGTVEAYGLVVGILNDYRTGAA